jgi:NADPH-dependent ferric siderophore reductase
VAENYDSIPTHVTTVARTEQLTPHVRRVTFTGGLDRFVPESPDAFVYLLLPPDGRRDLTVDTGFTWTKYRSMPEADRPLGAYYTVRYCRPDAGELDIDMVLHGDDGACSRWARRAAPGDPVALWGPRVAFAPPPGTDHYVLVADDTGLPAVGAIAEWLPADVSAQIIVEVADAGEERPIESRAAFDVTWLHRNGTEPGRSSALVDAVATISSAAPRTYFWGGGESRTMTAIRNHVRRTLGVARGATSFTPYWRLPDSPIMEEDDE